MGFVLHIMAYYSICWHIRLHLRVLNTSANAKIKSTALCTAIAVATIIYTAAQTEK